MATATSTAKSTGAITLIDFAFSAQDETTTAAAACLGGGLVDEGTMALASMAKIVDHYALFGNDHKNQVQTLLGD